MSISNTLQIPLVIFTSMENYPITQVIPRTRVLSEVPIYLAYSHSDSGHYNLAVQVNRTQSNSVSVEAISKEQDKNFSLRSTKPINMKQDAHVVAELQGRQGKMNSANHISRAVLVFVIYVAAMISVHVIRASIHSVERWKRKLNKKASLICHRERDKNKTFKKISTRQTEGIWK